MQAVSWNYECIKPFCCDRHQLEVSRLQKEYILNRRSSNLSVINVGLLKADTYKNGFLSREILRVLAVNLLIKTRHFVDKVIVPDRIDDSVASVETAQSTIKDNISTSETLMEDLELLLDKCIMTTANQLKLCEWGSIEERTLKLCRTIPFQQYDNQLFAYLLVNWVAELDVQRLIA